jgi:hypothetical protein
MQNDPDIWTMEVFVDETLKLSFTGKIPITTKDVLFKVKQYMEKEKQKWSISQNAVG